MDMCDDPDNPRITAVLELPGLKQEDISVRIEADSLIVQGERRSPLSAWTAIDADSSGQSAVTPKFKVQELKYGAFRRDIVLPAGMQVGHVRASLSEGMLTLSWPRNPLSEPLALEHAQEDHLDSDDGSGGGGGPARTPGSANI
ncbi:hypothetical protein B0H21DRAFT_824211 [Amylocystis lapponica]|nr:hypothetical protein B0H21DRAFT_824211 [Amylocystis lapponica]